MARSSSGFGHGGAHRVSSRPMAGLPHAESHAVLKSTIASFTKCCIFVCVQHRDPPRVVAGATQSPFMRRRL